MNQNYVRKKEKQYLLLLVEVFIIRFFIRESGALGIGYFVLALSTLGLIHALTGICLGEDFWRSVYKKFNRGDIYGITPAEKHFSVFHTFIGVLGGLILFAVAGQFSNLFGLPELKLLLQVLALYIPLRNLRNSLSNLLFAHGYRLLHEISWAIEVIAGILSASLIIPKLTDYGEKVSGLLRQDKYIAYYIILGAILAVVISQLAADLYLVVVTVFINKKWNLDDYTSKRGGMVLPAIYKRSIYDILYRFIIALAFLLVCLFAFGQEGNAEALLMQAGVFFGSVGFIILVICIAVEFFTVSTANKMVLSVAKEDRRNSRNFYVSFIQLMISFGMLFIILCLVLSEQIAALTGDDVETVNHLVLSGTFFVLPAVFVAFCSKIWKHYQPWLFELMMLLGSIVWMVLYKLKFMEVTGDLGILSSAFLVFGILSLVFLIFTSREYGISTDWLPRVVVPILVSSAVGLLALLLKTILYPHLGALVTIIICFAFGILIYWTVLFMLRIIHENDVKNIPVFRLIYQLFHHKKQSEYE